MHVVHVTGGFASDYFLNLGAYASSDVRHSLVVLGAAQDVAALEHVGIRVHAFGSAARREHLRAARQLTKILRTLRPDVVQGHTFDAGLLGMTAAAVLRHPHRVLTRHHADAHHEPHRPVHVALDRIANSAATSIVAVSAFTRDVLVERERVAPSKVVVIPHGVDAAALRRAAEAPLHEPLPDSPFRILVAGRLHPEKGQRTAVAAMEEVVAAAPAAQLVLAGDGPDRAALESAVERSGLRASVRLLGFRRDLPALMRSADAVLIPSNGESFGQVAVEAMALGRPVVATRVGGLPELLDLGTTGILVPPGDAAAMADALLSLMRDPEGRAELAARAEAHCLANYGVGTMVQRYESMYRELVSR